MATATTPRTWAGLIDACADRLATEAEQLDTALLAPGLTVAARHDALWRFGRAVRNAQQVLVAAERVQGVKRTPDRALGRAYWELRRLVEDCIRTGAVARRQLAAARALLEREQQIEQAGRLV